MVDSNQPRLEHLDTSVTPDGVVNFIGHREPGATLRALFRRAFGTVLNVFPC
jgi:hypothetical protein